MIAMIIGFLIVVLSFNFFILSYQINGINRIVLGTPLALYETAIVVYDIDEEKGPYFSKEILENNITTYLNYHLSRYAFDYYYNFYYYKIADHSLDMSDEAKAVEVNVSAYLAMNTYYEKTMFYEIRRY